MGIRNLRARLLPILSRLRGRVLRIGPGARIASTARLDPGSGSIHIGEGFEIHHGAAIFAGDGAVRIGNNVSVQHYTLIYGTGGVTIGNDVRIAGQVMIVPFNHVFSRRDVPIRKQGLERLPVVIEDDVWIGGGARILAGVTVARGCVVAAGAVVRRSTDPYGIYAGVPARRIKDRA